MRAYALTVIALLLAPPAWAQQATAPVNSAQRASAADVAALVQKINAERKDKQPLAVGPLIKLAPYTVNIESRNGPAPASVHDKDAELFYVISGAGTLTTGGKLVDATRTNPENQRGSAIEGGSAQRLAPGDFVMVPAGVPHWFGSVEDSLVLMSLHLPAATSK